MKILHEVAAGAGPVAERIVDRAQAIGIAIAEAAANDVVLIAGKGHRPYQEVLGQRVCLFPILSRPVSRCARGMQEA